LEAIKNRKGRLAKLASEQTKRAQMKQRQSGYSK